jgi:hypothetical protein
MTTLQELSDRWNLLRNAALGRGTSTPKGISSELADEVGAAYDGFRAWLIGWQGPLSEVQSQALWAGPAGAWADRYVELAQKVTEATGVALPGRPEPVAQQAAREMASAAIGSPLAIALFVGAGAVLAWKLLAGLQRAR